ncbi:hypothetical protein SADUNF_Sadunf07G0107500 [Salix dunnii]|uniref:Wall-associated receptor kinase galacturonan-binding domain-containing protein n=1 Tax=Salix dunnii TaxID=1413687 RepID=A0A835JX79_9ROSI|nr:hypothetical protein SADUNF_Sadunf07G0107500 [Salix dunnii]
MARLLFACLLLLLLLFQTSYCKDTNPCAPSSCGNQTISDPFSLHSDPLICGNPLYTLHCEENTFTVLYLNSRKYYVQAINYNNLKIRVVDAGVKKNDCSSLPDLSFTPDNLDDHRNPYTYHGSIFHTLSPRMARLLFACLLLLPLLFQTSNCKDTNPCAPSSCGNQTISNPFRLDSDPLNCGNPLYTLHCENTSTVLYLDSRKYYVQTINYDNLTIRVVDAGVKKNDCSSLPDFSLTYARLGNPRSAYGIFTIAIRRFDYIGYPYTWFQYKKTRSKWFPKYKPLALSQMMTFINCANPVNSPLYVDTGTCLNGAKYSNVSLSTHSYVNVGGMKASDLMALCSLERTTLLPVKDYQNMTFKEIHSLLEYGFELSWHSSLCGSCSTICYMDDSYHTKCTGWQY